MIASTLERSGPQSSGKGIYSITVMYIIDTCISPPNSPIKAGAEKQLYLLASSLNPETFKSIVVQLSPDEFTTGNVGPFELFHLPTRRLYSLSGLNQQSHLISIAKSKRVDIIHTFFEKSEVMGWLTARLAKIPVWVTSRRDLGFKRKKIYENIFRSTSKDCKKCIANCNAVREQAIQQEHLPPEKIEVIYNGLDFSEYQESQNNGSLRRELGVENPTPLVGMIANFYFEIKGHRYFLEAAKKILEKIPKVKFLLIGDGPLRQQYEEMVRKLGMSQNILFLGNRTDVAAIISSLDISVLSSTSEGLSNVILESMAAGKPVVATDVGGNSEMVMDGMTGYLIPPANSDAMTNAILNLLENSDKAKAMGSEGKKVVLAKFTVEAMVKSYENLYRSLMFNRQ
jgi:glycosyltransferase involved in cell wall biosynthesis